MKSTPRFRRFAIVGCGYVGTAAGRALVTDGCDVVGTTTRPERFAELSKVGITPAVARVDQIEKLRELFVDRDAVLVCMAAGRRRGDYHAVYAQGARNIVAALTDTPVERIIYTSSTRVYHEDHGGWVDEASPTVAVDEASEALIDAEDTLLEGGRKIGASTSILRLGGIHGAGRELTEQIRAAAGSSRDDGDEFVNLIHAPDIVDAIVGLTRVAHHGLLNLTDGRPTARRVLYDRILAAYQLPPITWRPTFQSKLGKRVRSDRVRELLGVCFKPAISPED